jgi:uncharacterized membrane protein YheB (UPF0754 family)
MSIWLWCLPLISAFIGWFTNWIAIKMLFHPKEPKRILGITFQGIFPKRQAQFAQKLGALVSKELLSFDDIQAKINNPNVIALATNKIDGYLDNFLKNKLTEQMPILSMFISNDVIDKIKTSLNAELTLRMPEILGDMTNSLKTELDIEKIVTSKVQAFSSDKLEEILNDIMKKEFVFVEIIGGVLGFIIGLLQLLITNLSA